MRLITATYIGKIGSLGYIHGKEYRIDVSVRPSEILDSGKEVIYFDPGEMQGCLPVEYEDFVSGVLSNWKNITAI